MRVLSLLDTPIEVQLRDETVVSSTVTPATVSIPLYLRSIQAKDSRLAPFIPYSPFPFTMLNHINYYDRDRPENKNHVYIRVRTKTSSIWGNWLRIPDVYYGDSYHLCRIQIPVDKENNFNYCYLVNRYSDVEKVNRIELLPAILFKNCTDEPFAFKYYVNEGMVTETAKIDFNYAINNSINSLLSLKPFTVPDSVCSKMDIREGFIDIEGSLLEKDHAFVLSIQNELKYWVEKTVLYQHRGNHYQVQLITIHPLLYYVNRIDEVMFLRFFYVDVADKLFYEVFFQYNPAASIHVETLFDGSTFSQCGWRLLWRSSQ